MERRKLCAQSSGTVYVIHFNKKSNADATTNANPLLDSHPKGAQHSVSPNTLKNELQVNCKRLIRRQTYTDENVFDFAYNYLPTHDYVGAIREKSAETLLFGKVPSISKPSNPLSNYLTIPNLK